MTREDAGLQSPEINLVTFIDLNIFLILLEIFLSKIHQNDISTLQKFELNLYLQFHDGRRQKQSFICNNEETFHI